MKITGMDHFQKICMEKLVEWYNNKSRTNPSFPKISLNQVYVVWSVKVLQNYKCLVSTSIDHDGIYAEYTFNGDKEELYEDVYEKLTNKCITVENIETPMKENILNSDNRMNVQYEIKNLKEDMEGCYYRHFKGNIYVVTDIAVHSETEEPMVIYRNYDDSDMVWCRPLSMFLSEVDHEKYPDVKQKKRFEKVF